MEEEGRLKESWWPTHVLLWCCHDTVMSHTYETYADVNIIKQAYVVIWWCESAK